MTSVWRWHWPFSIVRNTDRGSSLAITPNSWVGQRLLPRRRPRSGCSPEGRTRNSTRGWRCSSKARPQLRWPPLSWHRRSTSSDGLLLPNLAYPGRCPAEERTGALPVRLAADLTFRGGVSLACANRVRRFKKPELLPDASVAGGGWPGCAGPRHG